MLKLLRPHHGTLIKLRNFYQNLVDQNDESLIIPLVDKAMKVLLKRRSDSYSSHKFTSDIMLDRAKIFVFPGIGKDGYMNDPKKGWKRILDRAGIEKLRLHDLRRTMCSYQAMNGSSMLVIGQSLGHKSASATQVYARFSNEPIRNSINDAVNAMMEYGNEQ